jgi:hypothetical protein
LFLFNYFSKLKFVQPLKVVACTALGASVRRLRTALSTAFVDKRRRLLMCKSFLLIPGAAATVTRIFLAPQPTVRAAAMP